MESTPPTQNNNMITQGAHPRRLFDDLEGQDGQRRRMGRGGRLKREGICIYIYMYIYIYIYIFMTDSQYCMQKLIQHCKVIILQFKKK